MKTSSSNFKLMAYIGKTITPAFQYLADQKTVVLAKSLRRNMTSYEKVLWQCLRSNKIEGLKFRRQHPIRYYIADFYCHEARLVVEVDGPIHLRTDRLLHDEQRDGVIENFGIKILRFSNDEIRYHIKDVLRTIGEVAMNRAKRIDSLPHTGQGSPAP
jgi:very-short-patch-repair endonuclease